jgi:opacity protein-like surface antigen
MPVRLVTLVLLLALGPSAAVAAAAEDADASASIFSLAGFGTLGVVHSSESQADFANTFQANGAGHTRNWSPTVDSLIGGQLTANFTPRLSAVLQVIVQQGYDNSYRPRVEWANLRYEVTPDFSVRVGRTALPVFMENDSRRLGYANPWVRPPAEFYRLVPVSSSDGIDASYRMSMGAAINTLQISAGRADTHFPGSNGVPNSITRGRRLLTVVDTIEQGFLILHFTYLHARLTVDSLKPLFDAYRQFGPQGVAIADRYEVHDRAASFLGVGANYSPGHWFVMSEWGHFESKALSLTANAWYVSAGYRMGAITPYATFSNVKPVGDTSDPGLDPGSLPPALAPQVGALNAGLNAALASAAIQRTISLGARWDFRRNMDAKLQFDHSRIGGGSAGLLTNPQPGFQRGGTVNLISATVDFVF